MERYTLQQRIEIIKIHYKNGENLAVTVRKTTQKTVWVVVKHLVGPQYRNWWKNLSCWDKLVMCTQKNYSYMGYIFFILNAINIVKNGIVDFYYCICYIFYETLISVIVII